VLARTIQFSKNRPLVRPWRPTDILHAGLAGPKFVWSIQTLGGPVPPPRTEPGRPRRLSEATAFRGTF